MDDYKFIYFYFVNIIPHYKKVILNNLGKTLENGVNALI